MGHYFLDIQYPVILFRTSIQKFVDQEQRFPYAQEALDHDAAAPMIS